MCLFFDWMLELASDVSKLSALCKASSYEEFINIFGA